MIFTITAITMTMTSIPFASPLVLLPIWLMEGGDGENRPK